MKFSRYSIYLVACLSCVLVTGVIAAAEDSEAVVAAALASRYSDAISSCTFVTLDSAASEVHGYTRMLNETALEYLGEGMTEQQLTLADKRRLGLWKLPDGTASSWHVLFEAVRRYYHENGQLPVTGLDLYPDLRTEDGLAGLLALPAAEAVLKYREAIDPISGGIYSNLQAPNWEPAAMSIRVVDDPQEVERLFPHLKLPVTNYEFGKAPQDTGEYTQPSEAWYVTIYGEKPGSVLYENVIAL